MTFVHKEYPRCLHGAGGMTCLVQNDEERDTKLAEGWSMRPVLDEAPSTPEAPAAEDPPAVEPAAKKRGRKSKSDD